MFLPFTRAASVGSFIRPRAAAPVDNTPAGVTWTNIISSVTPATSIGQQITSITSTITLKLNLTSGGVSTVSYGTNTTNSTPASFTQIGSGTPFSGDTSTFTVSNNNWLFFRFGQQFQCNPTTVKVINTSDSNTQLSSFAVTFQPKGGCA